MKAPHALSLLFLSLVHLTAHAQTGVPIPKLARFDTAMSALLTQYKVPGGQLALTYQGKLVYSRGFGYADTSAKVPVQPNSLFRLASLSKQITSITILHWSRRESSDWRIPYSAPRVS